MQLSEIARQIGPVVGSGLEARFARRPSLRIRHKGGTVCDWYCDREQRGGGVESLCRMLRLRLPPAERGGRYTVTRYV